MDSILAGENSKLYKWAFGLAIFTIVYNLAEGAVSTFFGYEDEVFTLFGFGVDSFIEAVSGLGIAQMVLRIQKQPGSNRGDFERSALRITGGAFYVLAVSLVAMAIYNLITEHKPLTTFWGLVISGISIAVMWVLVVGKTKIGHQLNSAAILADASCTKVCIYMSVILLASSAIYELSSFAYADALGAIGLAYFSFKEGKECFEKIKTNKNCGCEHD